MYTDQLFGDCEADQHRFFFFGFVFNIPDNNVSVI